MTETYLSLGPRADWRMFVPMGAIFVVMPWLLKPFARSRGGSVNPMHWGMFAWGIWMIIGSILGSPQSTMVLVMPFFMAAAMLAPWNDPRMPLWFRGVALIAFACLGWFGVTSQVGREKIVLGDSNVQIQESPRRSTVTIQRDEVTVLGLHNLRTDAPGKFDWFLRRNDYDIGPLLQGKNLYWGPRGTIRGDQVALRVASWAGVKPQYDIYSY